MDVGVDVKPFGRGRAVVPPNLSVGHAVDGLFAIGGASLAKLIVVAVAAHFVSDVTSIERGTVVGRRDLGHVGQPGGTDLYSEVADAKVIDLFARNAAEPVSRNEASVSVEIFCWTSRGPVSIDRWPDRIAAPLPSVSLV